MLLRLSQDKGRASSIGSRYFKTEAEWEVIDGGAFGFKVAPQIKLNKAGDISEHLYLSPIIEMLNGARGCLLLSSHPELGGDVKLITPDALPRQGYLTVKTKDLNLDLPYHFRISILPHGHLS